MTDDDNLRVRIAIVKLVGMSMHVMANTDNDEWDAVMADAVDSNVEALRLLDPTGTAGLDRNGMLEYGAAIWRLYVRDKKVSREGFEHRPVIPPTGRRGEA